MSAIFQNVRLKNVRLEIEKRYYRG